MSQTELVPSSKSVPNFPAIAYKGFPVLTTDMLAQAYGVSAKQIRQNFNNNRMRFAEGKHFFSITGKELKKFRLGVEIIDAQISPKIRVLTLWTDRGSARHAKMLESDSAWDVYEMLEDTFFAVKKEKAQECPVLQRTYTLPAALYDTATKDQRRPVDQALKAWVAAVHANDRFVLHAEAWKILRAHFGNISRIDQIPAVWVDDAAQFCREMMQKELQAAPEQKALPQAQASLPVSRPRRESLLSDAEKDRLEAAGQRVIALSVYIRREVHELHMEILRAVDPRRVPGSVWDAMSSHIYYSLLGAVRLTPESLTRDALFDKENLNPAYWTMEMLKDMPALR